MSNQTELLEALKKIITLSYKGAHIYSAAVEALHKAGVEVEKCDFCEDAAIHFYGLGTKRCRKCGDAFNEENLAKRLAIQNAQHVCTNCSETFCGPAECPHCCEHEFDAGEGYHCLSCGTDGTEDVMSSAYDRAKDYAKYGDS